MRYTRQVVLVALALISTSGCSSPGGTESSEASRADSTVRTATVLATEEERAREIERRAALRGEPKLPPGAVATPAGAPESNAEAPAVVGEVPDTMLAAMKADLATRLGRSVDAARVIRAEQVVWPDGSIGCAQPGGIYTQATVVGYLVEIEFDGKRYRYHSALHGTPIYCERPGSHLETLGPAK
jgi:hypothetical protein